MCEQLSGLLGLEGFTVSSVEDRVDELDLEVEFVAGGGPLSEWGSRLLDWAAVEAGESNP